MKFNIKAVETEFRVARNLRDFAIITSDLRAGSKIRKFFVWEQRDLHYLREQKFVERRWLNIDCDLTSGPYPTISNIKIDYPPYVLQGDQRNLNTEFVNIQELPNRSPKDYTVDNANTRLD